MRSKIKAIVFTLGITVCFSASLFAMDMSADKIINDFRLKESEKRSNDMKGWRVVKKVVIWGNESAAADYQREFPKIEFFASRDEDDVIEALETADVFIGTCKPQLFSASMNIRWIQSLAVGVEKCVNSAAIQNSEIVLTNTQRLSSPAIAEHAIAMMFSLVRRLDQYGASQSESEWDRSIAPGREKIWEINGKTMLVVGLGGIGSETAKRANALGMKVIATRNSRRTGPDYVDYVGLSDELLTLTKQADVIVNTVPLTSKTTGMFDKTFFKAMKKTAYFINVARGRSVVTDDLVDALEDDELAGAGLDVTDPEPLPDDHDLWEQPRVIITPHVAYRSEKVRQRVKVIAMENLRRYINGEKLLSVVNIQRGY